MTLYTITLTIDDSLKDGYVYTNDYVRGIFTELDGENGAIKEAEKMMANFDVDDKNHVQEVYISSHIANVRGDIGIGIIGWLNDNGEFWKYFERKNGQYISYANV